MVNTTMSFDSSWILIGKFKIRKQANIQNIKSDFIMARDLHYLQSRPKVYKRSLNKPYENEVTLRGQNPPLKCYQDLKIFYSLKKD